MYLLLPLLFFVLAFLCLYSRMGHGMPSPVRVALLLAAIAWGLLVVAATELLSLVHGLTPGWMAASWALGDLILAAIAVASPRAKIRVSLLPLPWFERVLLLFLILIVALTGVTALAAPPNNWDSMTYHMSRVAHWAQNRSVAFYPTSIPRQLYQNPWAEFAILNLQILSGGDRFANLVQWFSMIGAIIAVSLIAERLGGSRRAQWLAAMAVATIPMGILQASSTQNDYVAAFWLACFVYFSMLVSQAARPSAGYAAAAGASLGLAVLTKATVYVYALPFLLWLCTSAAKRLRLSWRHLMVIAALTLVPNLGHYARNLGLYGNPLGPASQGSGFGYSNSAFSIPLGASNIVRNVALHTGTPIGILNTAIYKGVGLVHAVLRVDINDPRTTWPGTQFQVPPLWLGHLHEDSAGNPLHLYVVSISLAVLLYQKQRPERRLVLTYAGSTLAAFLLFCLILKWQPWHSRLHLPVFVFWCPPVGIALSWLSRRAVSAVSAAMILVSLPYATLNSSRPLLGSRSVLTVPRNEQYFANRPELAGPYRGAAEYVSSQTDCSCIGLLLGSGDWEYPLWVLLQGRGRQVQLGHVDVGNASATTALPDCPCAIISTRLVGDASVLIAGQQYAKSWSSGPVAVLTPVTAP